MSHFSDSVSWKDRWNILRNVGGGGQAESFAALSKVDRQSGFLKVLRAQQNEERRARFYREAVAYDSLSHDGLPKLIETNAQHFADKDHQLFIVSEFIEGPSLAGFVSAPLSLDQAVAFMTPFLEILAYLHVNGTVHRDIKPDNVLLRDGRIDRPVLVDLGLSYHSLEESLETDLGQEIGNRFLRLPELSAGSLAKQDPASDVTFAAGLLFYLLTAEFPHTLLDEAGRLPHQRPNVLERFDRDSPHGRRLLTLFDRMFAYRVDDRVKTPDQLSNLIGKLTDQAEDFASFAAQVQEFEAELNTPELQNHAKFEERLDVVMNCASHANHDVGARLKARYLPSQTAFDQSFGMRRNHLGLVDKLDRGRSFYNTITAEAVGSEIRIILNGEEFARVDAMAFDARQLQEQFVERFMISAMKFHRGD